MPFSFLNSSTSQSMSAVVEVVAAEVVSPLVAFTWNTPSPISRIEMSKVPPPRS
jgi:hypothetical protein